MAKRAITVARRPSSLGGAFALVALIAIFAIPFGGPGGVTAAAAYYYYGGGGAGVPANLVLTPATATNPVGTTHTVTATVTDTNGDPVQGVIVRFSVGGSVTRTGQCTTNSAGQCSFTYSGPAQPGTDLINAFADTDASSTADSGEPAAVANKQWVLPASTSGKATGSGQIVSGGQTVTFDFNATGTPKIDAGCTVIAKTTKRKIQCANATTYVQSGNVATFYGSATDNGTATTYVIRVVDNSEPGSGDTFSIQTASGFSASGTLVSGNIQVH